MENKETTYDYFEDQAFLDLLYELEKKKDETRDIEYRIEQEFGLQAAEDAWAEV